MILRGLVLFCRQAFSYRLGGPGIRRLRSCPGCRASLHDAISDPTLDVTAGIEISTLTLPTGLGLASIDDRALVLYRRDCGLSRSSHYLRRCISLHHHAGVDGQHGAVAGLRDDRHVRRVGGNLTPPVSLWKDELLHWHRGDADHVEPLCQAMRWCRGGDSLALRAVGHSPWRIPWRLEPIVRPSLCEPPPSSAAIPAQCCRSETTRPYRRVPAGDLQG